MRYVFLCFVKSSHGKLAKTKANSNCSDYDYYDNNLGKENKS